MESGKQPGITIISAGRPPLTASLLEVAKHRELVWVLFKRQLTIRYRQTVVGAAWVLFQPLMMMAVFSLVFSYFARVATGDVPYYLFFLAGYIHWQFFARCVAEGAGALVAEQGILARVYFPAVIAPLAFAAAGLFDMLIAAALFVAWLALFYYTAFPLTLAVLPLMWAILVAISIGAMLFATALNVRFRDVGILVPFLVLVLLFLSPVVYPASVWPAAIAPYMKLNPMAGVILGIDWAFFGRGSFPANAVVYSAVWGLCLLAGGFYYFNRSARSFGDYLK